MNNHFNPVISDKYVNVIMEGDSLNEEKITMQSLISFSTKVKSVICVKHELYFQLFIVARRERKFRKCSRNFLLMNFGLSAFFVTKSNVMGKGN